MLSPRGWILVIEIVVFLAAGGDSLVRLGSLCCKADWETLTDELIKMYNEHTVKVNSPAFFAAMESWYAKVTNLTTSQELEDLCGGFIPYKCEEGSKNISKCVCSNDTGYVLHEGICRIPEPISVPCMGGLEKDQCMEGTCDVAEGKQFGVCKVGGVDNSILMKKMMRVMEKNFSTDKPGSTRRPFKKAFPLGLVGKMSTASNVQHPIMWVIIGGLSLIPPASS